METTVQEPGGNPVQEPLPIAGTAGLRIGLLGPYASRNLGDTAIQMSVISNLRRLRPSIEFLGICPEPMDTTRTHGIPAFPLSGLGAESRMGGTAQVQGEEPGADPGGEGAMFRAVASVRRISAFIRTLDLLVISGGGQLDDFWGGPWGHPYSLFCWMGLARRHNVPVAVLGVGMDRLNSRLSRYFAISALKWAQFRAVRDEGTLQVLRTYGFKDECQVCPDLAFGLDVDALAPVQASQGAPYVVVSPISEKTWQHETGGPYIDYLHALQEACLRLTKTGMGIKFVCSQSSMDPHALRDVLAALPQGCPSSWQVEHAVTVADYLRCVRGARLVVASRLHGLILALVAGTPVVAISPFRKVEQLMRDVDLSFYCVDLFSVKADHLIQLIEYALGREDALRLHVRRHTGQFRARLGHVFDDVLKLG